MSVDISQITDRGLLCLPAQNPSLSGSARSTLIFLWKSPHLHSLSMVPVRLTPPSGSRGGQGTQGQQIRVKGIGSKMSS